jgi:hypothetical protein
MKKTPQGLVSYHISADGTVTEVPVAIEAQGNGKWTLVVQIPGFSIYSVGDGEDGNSDDAGQNIIMTDP